MPDEPSGRRPHLGTPPDGAPSAGAPQPEATQPGAPMPGDEEAAAAAESVDEVRRLLGGGDAPPPVPEEPMPELVAARLRRALIAAEPPASSPERPRTARPGAVRAHTRRALIAAAAVAAALVIVLPTAAWLEHRGGHAGSVVAADAPPRAEDGAVPPAADSLAHRLNPAQVIAMQGADDPGRYADRAALDRCLVANGLPAGSPLLGAGPVHVDGIDGTLLLVPGPHPPMLTGLVVDASCGESGPGLLSRTDIGGP